jgi:hypothetical protein
MLYFNKHGFKQRIKDQQTVFVIKAWQYVLNHFTVFCKRGNMSKTTLLFSVSMEICLKPLYCFLFDIYTGGGGEMITWKEKGRWRAGDERKFRCINQLLLPSSSLIIFYM